MAEIDGVLHDIDLVGEGRSDVDSSIGNDERLGMARDIHHEAVTEPPRGTQTAVALHDGAHELVGMKTSLHQRFRPALADQLDGPQRRGVAVLGLDDRQRGDIEAEFDRRSADAFPRTDQDRSDQPEARRVDSAFQRALVAGVCYCGRRRACLLRSPDQPIVFFVFGRCDIVHENFSVNNKRINLNGRFGTDVSSRPGEIGADVTGYTVSLEADDLGGEPESPRLQLAFPELKELSS